MGMFQPQEHRSWTSNIDCKIEMFTSAWFFTDVAALKPNLLWRLLICSLSPLAKQDLEMKSLPTDCVQKQFVKMRTCNTVLLTLAHPPVTPWTLLKSPAPESQSRVVSPTCVAAKKGAEKHADSNITLQTSAESCRPNPRVSTLLLRWAAYKALNILPDRPGGLGKDHQQACVL